MFPRDPVTQFQVLTTVLLVGSFIWAWFETRLSIKFANQLGLLAPVTPRSAHRVPTPTIGGMGVVDTVLIVAIILNLLPRGDGSMIYGMGLDARLANWVLIICGVVIAGMGLVDDWRVVRPLPKFMIQVLCAIPPAWLMRHGSWIGEDTWGWLWGTHAVNPVLSEVNDTWMWMTFGLNIVWVLVVINIFNFMDGMDGLAGLFTAVVAMTLAALVAQQVQGLEAFIGLGELFFIALTVIGAALGFLRLNLPPAQTFMGDVGSQFLGWALATLALMAHVPLASTGGQDIRIFPTPWAPLLLFLPFLGDGLFTMARRARRGENIFKPHFTHLYQRLLTTGRGHAQVLLVEALLMTACGTLTLALLWVRPSLQPLLGLSGLGLMLAMWLHVRAAETEPPKS
jgi:Fuc2NAc and GlcNAc transferase